MVYNYRKVSRRAVPLNSTTFYYFDPSTRVKEKLELCANTNVSFPAFLLTYHIVMWWGGSAFESFGRDMSHHLTQKLTRNGQTDTFVKTAILSGAFLMKQIESLSFSIDSVQQTDPAVYAY